MFMRTRRRMQSEKHTHCSHVAPPTRTQRKVKIVWCCLHNCSCTPFPRYATSDMPRCYFPSSQTLAVPVLAVRAETHISKVITFGLPPKTRLNLPVSSCLMMLHGNGSTARPYNPISPHTAVGSFQLLIKTYPDGTCSKYADYLKPGDVVQFKQLDVNVKPWQFMQR